MSLAPRVEATVLELIAQALQAARSARTAPVTLGATLSELGVGSMMLLELATAIEDRLGIELPIDDVARTRTVAELIALVTACASTRAARLG
ncbi:MAG TPA: acyl carrier protein [Polyangiaceae bacterium]|nr:acyl carrier protein [Polyangiaceae bacterium]